MGHRHAQIGIPFVFGHSALVLERDPLKLQAEASAPEPGIEAAVPRRACDSAAFGLFAPPAHVPVLFTLMWCQRPQNPQHVFPALDLLCWRDVVPIFHINLRLTAVIRPNVCLTNT